MAVLNILSLVTAVMIAPLVSSSRSAHSSHTDVPIDTRSAHGTSHGQHGTSHDHGARDIIMYGHGQSSVVKPHGTVSSHGAPGQSAGQSGNGDGINTDSGCVTSVVVLNGTGGARLSVGTNGVELSLGLSRVGTVMSTSTPASVRLAGSPSDAEGTLSAA